MNLQSWRTTLKEANEYIKNAPIKVKIIKQDSWINRYHITVKKGYYSNSGVTITYWGAKRVAKKLSKELEEYVNPYEEVVFNGLVEEME